MCIICYFEYVLNKKLNYEPKFCTNCCDLMMNTLSISNSNIVVFGGNKLLCTAVFMSKYETINELENGNPQDI